PSLLAFIPFLPPRSSFLRFSSSSTTICSTLSLHAALPIFGFLNLFLTLSLFLCGVLRLSALLFANALPVLFLRGRFDLKPRLCRSEERRVGKECTARVGAERSRRKSRRTRLRERSTKGRQS